MNTRTEAAKLQADRRTRLAYLLSQNNNEIFVRPTYNKSGMSCKIQCYIPTRDGDKNDILDVTAMAAGAIGSKWNDKDGTFTIRGGGMCMAFEAAELIGESIGFKLRMRRMS